MFRRIALWCIGRTLQQSSDYLKLVADQHPDCGVRDWARSRSKAYWQVLNWLKGETRLELPNSR